MSPVDMPSVTEHNGSAISDRTVKLSVVSVFGSSRGNFNSGRTNDKIWAPNVLCQPMAESDGAINGASKIIPAMRSGCSIDTRNANSPPFQNLFYNRGQCNQLIHKQIEFYNNTKLFGKNST